MNLPAAAALAVLAAGGVASGCGGLAPPPEQAGVEGAAIDWSVDPCADLYQFACGNWQRWNGIPADVAARAHFNDVQQGLIDDQYRLVYDDAQGHPGAGDPGAAKIGSFDQACLAALTGDATTGPELARQLQLVAGVVTLRDLATVLGTLRAVGTGALVDAFVAPNPDAPTANELVLGPGALSMDVPYYTDADQASFRAAYREHVSALVAALSAANHLGTPPAPDVVLGVETAMAAASPTPAAARDVHATHNPTTLAAFEARTPSFAWDAYLAAAGVPDPVSVDDEWPAYWPSLEHVLETTSVADLKAYVTWRVLVTAAPELGAKIQGVEFAFTKLFSGSPAPLPPYWQCFLAVRDELGFALSQPFVAEDFSGAARAKATQLIETIRQAFATTLDGEPWLDAPTLAAARAKLAAVTAKVGFPDDWTGYDDFSPDPRDYLATMVARQTWAWDAARAELGTPVDRTRWSAAPIFTNAFYSDVFNDITFPAAILQRPFFDVERSPAANYGSIGAVMGHELTHGFDDGGRQYDGTGQLRDWWSPTVAAAFQQRAQCIVDQFDAVHPLPGTMVNGALTLGETIADLGGLKLAYAAFHAPTGGDGQGAPGAFSPDQEFFVAFAQGWCENDRASYIASELESDPHPPWHDRINGAARNVPAFAQAFGCPAGAPLAPASRCEVW